MVESQEVFDGKEALITRPVSLSKLGDALPASWILTANGGFSVFEYSRDEKIKEICDTVTLTLLGELSNIIKKFSLENIIAPSLAPRNLYGSAPRDAYFVERSHRNPSFHSVIVP